VSIFGIVDDAHLVGSQYSWLGSILYIAQLVMQPTAAVLLVKFPNGKVIAAAIFLWGSSLCIMSACTNFASLLGMRFVLVSITMLSQFLSYTAMANILCICIYVYVYKGLT
jgi:MFS family permease